MQRGYVVQVWLQGGRESINILMILKNVTLQQDKETYPVSTICELQKLLMNKVLLPEYFSIAYLQAWMF